MIGWDDFGSHFLDSGAFTLWSRAREFAETTPYRMQDFYDTPEFWAYMDEYAEFVKSYDFMDLYSNMDAIGFPEITYRNQRYLEDKHGLRPVPVVHRGTDLKWLIKYIQEGYDPIGLGGLVIAFDKRSTQGAHLREWLDKVFNLVCDNSKRIPCVRLHGFGLTAYKLLVRYPWWSVDSVAWIKVARFGNIIVPQKRGGKFDFSEKPYIIRISDYSYMTKSSSVTPRGRIYRLLSEGAKAVVHEWLDHVGVPLGEVRHGKEGFEVISPGVQTDYLLRQVAVIRFFEKLRDWLPEYPWPFKVKPKPTLGVLD